MQNNGNVNINHHELTISDQCSIFPIFVQDLQNGNELWKPINWRDANNRKHFICGTIKRTPAAAYGRYPLSRNDSSAVTISFETRQRNARSLVAADNT